MAWWSQCKGHGDTEEGIHLSTGNSTVFLEVAWFPGKVWVKSGRKRWSCPSRGRDEAAVM